MTIKVIIAICGQKALGYILRVLFGAVSYSQGHAHLHSVANSTLLTYNKMHWQNQDASPQCSTIINFITHLLLLRRSSALQAETKLSEIESLSTAMNGVIWLHDGGHAAFQFPIGAKIAVIDSSAGSAFLIGEGESHKSIKPSWTITSGVLTHQISGRKLKVGQGSVRRRNESS